MVLRMEKLLRNRCIEEKSVLENIYLELRKNDEVFMIYDMVFGITLRILRFEI